MKAKIVRLQPSKAPLETKKGNFIKDYLFCMRRMTRTGPTVPYTPCQRATYATSIVIRNLQLRISKIKKPHITVKLFLLSGRLAGVRTFRLKI